jgi:thiosulfate reductase/polysulfide reductase chain A
MTSRREFLRLGGAVAAVGLAGAPLVARGNTLLKNAGVSNAPLLMGGKDFSPITYRERKAVPSACLQCVTRCPIIGYVEDGELVKISPQPASIRTEGTLCAKGQAGVNMVYDPDRLLYPLRRVGKRGEGKWKRVSWDEALGEIAGRMKKLRDEGHPEKFMFHYGRMKSSASAMMTGVFMPTYGSASIGNHDALCEASKWVAQELVWGGSYENWDFDNARFVLNFGSSVLEAGTNHTPLAHRLARARVDRNVRMVTFDVRLSNTAAKSSEWVPINPGTDAAVALAMCNVIMAAGLYDGDGTEFLKFCRTTKDFNATTEEKIAGLKAHLGQYTPEWAEKISGVPASKIRALAREVALGRPSCIISYRGAITHAYGVEAERAIQMLAAITGNVDKPGTRLKAVSAKWVFPTGPKDKPAAKSLPLTNGFKGEAALPLHNVSHQVLPMIKDGSNGRPDIYMWFTYQPVYSNGNCQFNIDVLKDESLIPFTVAVSPYYDESSMLADIILPDATFLERYDWEDNVSPTQVAEYYFRQPIVPPMGETRDFGDVICDLAKRIGIPLGFSSKEEFVRMSCELTPQVKKAGGFEYMKQKGVYVDPDEKPSLYSYRRLISAADLSAEGVIFDQATQVYWNWKKTAAKTAEQAEAAGYMGIPDGWKGYVGQRIGDQVYRAFPPDKINKSGYYELYSDTMETKGFRPMPSWYPIAEHEAKKPNELILTTHKVNVQVQSRTQNCKWLSEIYHDNPAWMNPATADAQGLVDGDLIRVRSEIGEITTKVRVTPGVVPGVLAISFHCGHWSYGRYASSKPLPGELRSNLPDPDASRIWWSGKNGVNPNWIIPLKSDPIGGEIRWNDTLVTVRKAVSA